MDEKLKQDMTRFARLSYDDFKRLAGDTSLSPSQRIGFPDAYREGFERQILEDVIAKNPPLSTTGGLVVDIGCGCTDVPRLLDEHATARGQELVLIDSQEMLDALPATLRAKRIPGKFPAMPEFLETHAGRVKTIIVYSVLHYVFEGADLFGFLDSACSLLAPGGHLFLGDLPNGSKRRRFFCSLAGIAFHKQFMATSEPPSVEPFALEPARLDDGVIIGIMLRYRMAGFETYLLPQGPTLPLGNRREDLLIVRP